MRVCGNADAFLCNGFNEFEYLMPDTNIFNRQDASANRFQDRAIPIAMENRRDATSGNVQKKRCKVLHAKWERSGAQRTSASSGLRFLLCISKIFTPCSVVESQN